MKRFIIIVGTLLCLSSILAEGAKYLIITHNSFTQTIQPLAQWKQKKGLSVKIANQDTISSWTTDGIRSYIHNAYYNWQIKPEYVLLVGYPPLLESFNWNGIRTDNPYSDMNDDTLSEIYVGRFPATTPQQCSTMVIRTLLYERTPYIIDTAWYYKGTTIANGTGTLYATWRDYYRENCLYVRNLMLQDEYTHVDTFFHPPSGSDPYRAESVYAAVNNGRTYLLYRGEATGTWRSPFQVDPQSANMNNYPKFPFVISGSCTTIDLYPQSNVLGEAWLRSGTATNPKGAVAYFGTTYVPSYFASHYRGAVVCGLFKALFQEESTTTGSVVRSGKDSLYKAYHFPNQGKHYVEWNLLGDPELNLWTAVPQQMAITYEHNIFTGSQSFQVTVTKQDNTPIANALVCVMKGDEVYQSDYTNSSGIVSFSIQPYTAGQMDVTVTAQNCIPYEGTCDVDQIVPEATYPNQGRHLTRTINTEECCFVYQGENNIYWQRQTEGSADSATLDRGKYPSIANDENGQSWVCYITEESHLLNCLIQRSKNLGDWNKVELFKTEDSIFAPSLVFATTSPWAPGYDGNLGYVVYATKSNENTYIHFSAFDSAGVYIDTILDSGSEDIFVSSPSIAITPEDFIHIVWQRKERGEKDSTCRIYYITTIEPITPYDIRHDREPVWSEITPISTRPPQWPTEPASNPFVEAYGDVVYAVWKGPNEYGDPIGEIWQRGRRLSDPYYEWWIGPWNVSESQDQESDYPVQSTSDFVAWQEFDHDNWQIKLRFRDDDVQTISNPERASKYPHINVRFPEYEAPYIYFIWTEAVEPDRLYEVRFLPYQYSSRKNGVNDVLYYSVNTGDSTPSFYCQHRDGYIRYPNLPIDFGTPLLSYQLPYLHPSYYYKAKAIAYHNATGRFKQRFSFDNIAGDSIEFQPGRPETIEIYIPKNTYQQDLKAMLRVNRSRGNFSALADFNLYQFEILDSTSSGPQSAGMVSIPLVSVQSFPNPFRTKMKIKLSLSIPVSLRLKIYNSSGRLVRTLLDETKSVGVYQINWDGTNDQNRLLSNGIYFLSLEADNYKVVRKTLLLR